MDYELLSSSDNISPSLQARKSVKMENENSVVSPRTDVSNSSIQSKFDGNAPGSGSGSRFRRRVQDRPKSSQNNLGRVTHSSGEKNLSGTPNGSKIARGSGSSSLDAAQSPNEQTYKICSFSWFLFDVIIKSITMHLHEKNSLGTVKKDQFAF